MTTAIDLTYISKENLKVLQDKISPKSSAPLITAIGIQNPLKSLEFYYLINKFIKLHPEAVFLNISPLKPLQPLGVPRKLILNFTDEKISPDAFNFLNVTLNEPNPLWKTKPVLKSLLKKNNEIEFFNISPLITVDRKNLSSIAFENTLSKISALMSVIIEDFT
jgi:hypothetical protein